MSTVKMVSRQEDIANTIFRQLGGIKTQVMTGMADLVYMHPDPKNKVLGGLAFSLPKNSNLKKINKVTIKLISDDTYRLDFYVLGRGMDIRLVETKDNIYAEQLVEAFKEVTGLITRV